MSRCDCLDEIGITDANKEDSDIINKILVFCNNHYGEVCFDGYSGDLPFELEQELIKKMAIYSPFFVIFDFWHTTYDNDKRRTCICI